MTDDANLKWLTSISPEQAKLAGWCMSMAEYDFLIQHRPGKELVVPDTLSRAPLSCPSDEVEALIFLKRKSLLFSLLPWISIYQHIQPH